MLCTIEAQFTKDFGLSQKMLFYFMRPLSEIHYHPKMYFFSLSARVLLYHHWLHLWLNCVRFSARRVGIMTFGLANTLHQYQLKRSLSIFFLWVDSQRDLKLCINL